MKKSLKSLIDKLHTDGQQVFKGGFAIIGGIAPSNASKTCTNDYRCSNTTVCESTNTGSCANTGTCSSTTNQNQGCTNSGYCLY